ncbi:PREDICTED: C-type lectin domain family 1 member B-like [Chlamydotis macqueenii]|uniref:C-type lectin domain family 1 member B-like n=1 Tax=Chlamydotis macqueenii TaxID=187382 RepID=UPI0005298781|nr:PREDICTED: C-type lectin domain family 1 member B-like [Chlamydotis macqueenii]
MHTNTEEEDGYSKLNQLPQHPARHYMSLNINKDKSLVSPFAVWRTAIFTLFALCLALIIGIIVLGLRGSKAPAGHNENLQGLKERLCLTDDANSKNNRFAFSLCPVNWKWVGGDTCFYFSEKEATWQESEDFCFSKNATLLILKRKSKLISISQISQKLSYWIGLSHVVDGWSWIDDTKLSTKRMDWVNLSSKKNCAYLFYHNTRVYSEDCYEKYPWICEKAAVQLI